MQAGGDAPPHQRVIGGVELDHVDALAARIVGFQDRRRLVGDPSELECLGRAPQLAVSGQLVEDRLRQRRRPAALRAGSEVNRLTPAKGGDWLKDVVRIGGRAQRLLPPPGGERCDSLWLPYHRAPCHACPAAQLRL